MASLLPPNRTVYERDIESVLARVSDVDVPINQIWHASTCPVALLPWLAWSLSVDEWDSDWSEAQQREAISSSIAMHRSKGTAGAVKNAIAALGYQVEVSEWFDTNGGPYSFIIYVDNENTPTSPQVEAAIRRVVAQSKNVRSHLLGIVMLSVTPPHTHILSTTIIGEEVTIYPE